MHPTIDPSSLYGERLDADLDGIRLLVDHAVRRMFCGMPETNGAPSVEAFLGAPIGHEDAVDPVVATRRNVRKALLGYLVDTGRVAIDDEARMHRVQGLAVSPEEGAQADRLASSRPPFAAVRELLGVFERRATELSQGVDGIVVLRTELGFERMQALWERLTLELPQRFVERSLAAELLLDRLRKQPAGATVLECGAGIGSVLRRALELEGFPDAISALRRYVYTDINPFLVEWSREWFRRNAPAALFERMEFRTLDLDAIGAAGLSQGGFDLAILDDVAHDVVDLRAALLGLGRLLSPGGWLVMTENFRQRPRDFMCVELFPMTFHGYNRARLQPGVRESSGFMTLADWRASLAEAGFGDPHVFPDPQYHPRWPMGALVAVR
ncbi:MAG: methyltransferase domain-containing protein [Pseudomonadota bacterium]